MKIILNSKINYYFIFGNTVMYLFYNYENPSLFILAHGFYTDCKRSFLSKFYLLKKYDLIICFPDISYAAYNIFFSYFQSYI